MQPGQLSPAAMETGDQFSADVEVALTASWGICASAAETLDVLAVQTFHGRQPCILTAGLG